jgi:hypothetical protein
MLCRRHRIRYEYSRKNIAPVQDWVQLPTKAEMDIYRGKIKPDLIITSSTWGTAPEFLQLKIKQNDGQKKQKEETNERNEKVSGGIT